MTRVSLTEDYDDRSVISKLNEMDKRVKENASVVTSAEASARQSAQSAQETADRFAGSVGAVVQNANAQINASKAQVDDAKAEVDATVTTVAQAVQTANNASASAQQSATTVATYGTRLTAVEDKAQGNSADIQHLEIETRDLYDRDANSVKLSPSADQTISRNVIFEDNIYDHGILYLKRYQAAMELDSTARRMSDKTLRGNAYGSIVIRDADDKICTLIQSSRDLEDDGSIKTSITGYNNLGESNYISIYRDNVTTKTPSGTVPSNAIVTKGYVESTDGVTNNLVHRTGNENLAHQGNVRYYVTTSSGSNRWREIYKWSGRFIGVVRVLSTRIQINDVIVYGRDERYLKWGSEHYTESELNPRIYQNDDGSYSLWMKIRVSDNTLAQIMGDYIGDVEVGTNSKLTLDGIPGTLIRELVE